MNQNQIVATPFSATRNVKKCACGTQFLAQSHKHDKCRGCHIKARKAEDLKVAQRIEAQRKAEEGRKAETEIRAMLKEMFVKNELPKHAKVTRSGSQVAVAWGGMSATFHMA